MNWSRVYAIVLRYLYLYKRSLPRLIEIFWWPTLELLFWGFVTLFLSKVTLTGSQSVVVNVLAFLLGALILWEIFSRSSLGVSIGFLEDLWSRNLINLFVSPLKQTEYLAGILTISFLKVLVTFVVTVVLALVLYTFNFFVLGPVLLPFVLNLLISGWVFGIFATAIILRYGVGAEVLAWGVTFALQPFAAVFYPVSIFPAWLQKLSAFLPMSHIFEGMRAVLTTGSLPVDRIVWAALLNFVYLVAAILFFLHIFKVARQRGYLLRTE